MIYVQKEYTLIAHMDRFRPEAFLPLTPVAFEILLSLADEPRHGYSILLEIETRSLGTIVLHAGTLYRALARLLETELIEELDAAPPDGETSDDRRRYYRLTSRGIAVLSAEVGRLEESLAAARASRVLRGARA